MTPKVLHIVENLDRGAVEGWLVRMLGHAHKRGVALDWTFYCALGQAGGLDDRARARGAKVIYSPVPLSQKRAFMAALRGALKQGRYDVVHCHHDIMSGPYLLAALGLPIGRRIVHAHNADENVPTPNKLKQTLYREPMRQVCLALADRIVGISNHTLDTLLAGRARRPGRDIVHYYGVDAERFQAALPDRAAFRRQLGLPEDALILLYGGRVAPEKNPVMAVDVLAALRRREPRAHLVYAGAGSEEQAVIQRAEALGVADQVHMIGWRADLPEVMAASDWFILPRPEHPMEGFGLAVVEAQLAGLPLLLSLGIPDDPLLPTASYRRLPLAAGGDAWAEAAIELQQAGKPSPQAAWDALAASPMDMDRALAGLVELHR